jgi:lipoprotein-releasing system permease protein
VQTFDENYIVVPLDFAEDLISYGDKRTSLEVKSKAGFNSERVEEKIQKIIGDKLNVLNTEEQHKELYHLLKMEKLFAFIALTMLLIVGSINIFFTLMMLALDKKKDITILSAMGAGQTQIRNIFLMEGSIIALIGAVIGLLLGGLFCWLQMNFGILSMGMESSVTEGYPIEVKLFDFIAAFVVVSIITVLISFYPSRMASRFANLNQL